MTTSVPPGPYQGTYEEDVRKRGREKRKRKEKKDIKKKKDIQVWVLDAGVPTSSIHCSLLVSAGTRKVIRTGTSNRN